MNYLHTKKKSVKQLQETGTNKTLFVYRLVTDSEAMLLILRVICY